MMALGLVSCQAESDTPSPLPARSTPASRAVIDLPAPRQDGPLSLEETLLRRRSVRAFTDQALTTEQLAQLLWAAQGITDPRGFRTAPSAGALYPLELYVVSADGFYRYQPEGHQLLQLAQEDLRSAVWQAGLQQDALRDAPAVFLITAVYQRTADKYGERATRYVDIEAGHAAQNLLLQAVALGLGGVPIGAFHDDALGTALSLPADHAPLYLLPVGYPQE